MVDQLTLTVNNKALTGWSSAEVVAGIERVPRSFQLGVVFSVDEALAKSALYAPAGQPCVLSYKGKPLLTGYIDSVQSRLSQGNHEIAYVGRGECSDVVDGSFEFFGSKSYLLNNLSIADTVKKIIEPSGVGFVVNNDPAKKITNLGYLTANLGDTSYSAIEGLNRVCGALLYEDGKGNFVMGTAGSEPASTATITHLDCIASTAHINLSNVYSDYFIYSQAEAQLPEKFGTAATGNYHNILFDTRKQVGGGGPRVRNYRKIVGGVLNPLIYDKSASYQQTYCSWFANRQMALAQAVTVEVFGWEDSNKQMWTPNSMVNVLLPHHNIQQSGKALPYLIVECRYVISPEQGTTTIMTLMPKDGFVATPQTIPLNADIAALITAKGQTAPASQTGPGGLQGHV
jgi:prophage tail gpP-like protein